MGRYNPDIVTPNLDRFAEENFVFESAYSTCPVCSPHRASLMSGTYPTEHGVHSNCAPRRGIELPVSMRCITDVLHDAGYATGYIGKWHLDDASEGKDPRPDDGATGWDAFTPPGPRRHGVEYWYSYGTFDDHLHPHYWHDTKEKIEVNEWSVAHETGKAIEYIDGLEGDRPFALFLSFNPPHSDYKLVPERFLDIYRDKEITLRKNVSPSVRNHAMQKAGSIEEITFDTKCYYAAISGIDHYFGELLDFLKRKGLYEDTVIIVSADHGDMMGSHGRMGKTIYYEEACGIPFIVHGGTQGTSDALIGSPDHAPTILGMLGLPPERAFKGADFSPMIRGEEQKEPYEDILIENFPGEKGYAAHGLNFFDYGYRCIKSHDYKYVYDKGFAVGDPHLEFYFDCKADPYELSPIKPDGSNQEIFARLRERLAYWMGKTNDNFLWDVNFK